MYAACCCTGRRNEAPKDLGFAFLASRRLSNSNPEKRVGGAELCVRLDARTKSLFAPSAAAVKHVSLFPAQPSKTSLWLRPGCDYHALFYTRFHKLPNTVGSCQIYCPLRSLCPPIVPLQCALRFNGYVGKNSLSPCETGNPLHSLANHLPVVRITEARHAAQQGSGGVTFQGRGDVYWWAARRRDVTAP